MNVKDVTEMVVAVLTVLTLAEKLCANYEKRRKKRQKKAKKIAKKLLKQQLQKQQKPSNKRSDCR